MVRNAFQNLRLQFGNSIEGFPNDFKRSFNRQSSLGIIRLRLKGQF